jgi:hypothetical protein
VAEHNRVQSGKPVAAAGAAEEHREVIADQSSASVGEDRRAFDQARPVLLAATGGEPPDAAAVREHGTADRGLDGADGIVGGCGEQEHRSTKRWERKGALGVSQRSGSSCLRRPPEGRFRLFGRKLESTRTHKLGPSDCKRGRRMYTVSSQESVVEILVICDESVALSCFISGGSS